MQVSRKQASAVDEHEERLAQGFTQRPWQLHSSLTIRKYDTALFMVRPSDVMP
jgi:hypothetical protein